MIETEKATHSEDLPHRFEPALSIRTAGAVVCKACGRVMADPLHGELSIETAAERELPRELGS